MVVQCIAVAVVVITMKTNILFLWFLVHLYFALGFTDAALTSKHRCTR
jgi:cytochrome b subunit of formate dehydrogenase